MSSHGGHSEGTQEMTMPPRDTVITRGNSISPCDVHGMQEWILITRFYAETHFG